MRNETHVWVLGICKLSWPANGSFKHVHIFFMLFVVVVFFCCFLLFLLFFVCFLSLFCFVCFVFGEGGAGT